MKLYRRPLLSICIPTKNRQRYCIEAIKTILVNEQDYFELIIQDNSDSDSLKLFIDTVNDKRLKYFYTKKPLASIENINISVERASGDFVCMIGDDDSILPHIFETVEYARANNIDSVCSTCLPAYVWPNEKEEGFLKISQFKKTEEVQRIDVSKKLLTLFRYGIIDYQQYYLPRLYHGIIRRSVLEEIKEITGAYFGGLSPDIYSTVALSSLVKNHVLINKPISIAGACPQSTTAQNQSGGHRGKLEDAPHLKNKVDYKWDELIPRFYSVETIWSESAIKSARDFSLSKEIKSFDLIYFFFISLKNNRTIRNIVLEESMIKLNKWKLFVNFIPVLFKYIGNLVTRGIVKKVYKKELNYNSVKDIGQAIEILSN